MQTRGAPGWKGFTDVTLTLVPSNRLLLQKEQILRANMFQSHRLAFLKDMGSHYGWSCLHMF